MLATLNGLAGTVLRSVLDLGWMPSVAGLFGVSAIVWAALAAGLAILHREPQPEPVRAGDWIVALLTVLAALVPVAAASLVWLTLLSLYALVTSGRGSAVRRAGLIFLALTGATIWGRLILALFSRPLLDIDAIFVSGLLGVEQQGNLLWSAETATRLVVAPGCSSMQGLSFALLFWVTLNQLFEVRLDPRAVLTCLAALAATVAINVLRIGAMLRFPEHLEAIHTGWGYELSMWTTLAAVGAICLYGARREIFRR